MNVGELLDALRHEPLDTPVCFQLVDDRVGGLTEWYCEYVRIVEDVRYGRVVLLGDHLTEEIVTRDYRENLVIITEPGKELAC